MSTTKTKPSTRRTAKTVTAPMLKGEITRREKPKAERHRAANYVYAKFTRPEIDGLLDGSLEHVDLDFNSGRKLRVSVR